MTVKVRIPSPLRRFTAEQAWVTVSAQTVGEAVAAVVDQFEDLAQHLYDAHGELRNFINIYVGEQDIRQQGGLDRPLREDDEIMIIPAIAGGTVSEATFDREEYLRYSRHFSLPEIGLEGQRSLKQSAVLVVGMGGLGNPAALYLAAAGVGHIGLVDFDVIDLSNLQRQILYSLEDVGQPKIKIAKERLESLNHKVEITAHEEALSSANAGGILADYDIIVDGTDNFPTRYLVNDVCVFQGKPNVYGSIFRFDGQVAVFHAKEGPCYRCLYANPPPPGLVPSCAEGGVLGVLPGIVGSLQAIETIKLITGAGEPLIGRLLLFDSLAMTFHQVSIGKDPNCSVCGANPTITEPIDYEGFCGVSGTAETVTVPEMSVQELRAKLENGAKILLLDVREPWEWEIAHIDEALLIPMNSMTSKLGEVDPSKEIVVHCHTGGRSAAVSDYLIKQGYTQVKNLRGGIRAWTLEVDPSLMQY